MSRVPNPYHTYISLAPFVTNAKDEPDVGTSLGLVHVQALQSRRHEALSQYYILPLHPLSTPTQAEKYPPPNTFATVTGRLRCPVRDLRTRGRSPSLRLRRSLVEGVRQRLVALYDEFHGSTVCPERE